MGKGRRALAGAIAAFALLLALPATSSAATASPTTLTFSAQRVGTRSGDQTVKVTVSGLLLLGSSINGYTVTGAAPGDFLISPAPTDTFSFPAGETGSKDYTVAFRPTALGARTATLTFSTTEPTGGGSPAVTLSGTGTQPAATLNPASPSLAFGTQENGTSSAARFFQLINSGDAPLTVSSITLGGANAAEFAVGFCAAATPVTIQPGKACLIGAVFKPTASGAKTAAIVIADDAAGSPRTIPLSGEGFVPDPGPPVAVTAPTANQKLRRTKKVRKRGKLVRRKVPLTFRGSASDPGGLARVELALVNEKFSGGMCTFFDGKLKTKSGACTALSFFKATITDKTWSYVLPAKATLASGKYVLVARAVNTKGVATRRPAAVRLRIAS